MVERLVAWKVAKLANEKAVQTEEHLAALTAVLKVVQMVVSLVAPKDDLLVEKKALHLVVSMAATMAATKVGC